MTDRGEHQHGAIVRALLWVVGGVALAVVAFVAAAPEVFENEPGMVVELVGLVALAGIPGIVLLLLAAVRRRRLGLDQPGSDPGGGDGRGHCPDRRSDRDL